MSARLLVVEDTPHTLELMTYLLSARGHNVVSAADGPAAMALVRAEPPDLVVLDIQLAGSFDGFETMRRIRSLPGLRWVPMLAVTAFAMVGDREHALRAGFDGYLTKPIDPFTFGEQVEAFLPEALRGHPPVLPLRRSGGVAAVAAQPARGSLTVMVVDDLPTNIELARSILEPSGYRVSSAATADEALASIRSEPPDLVLSDIHLGMDSGIELWRRLHEDPEVAAVPFAFVTATGALLSDLPSAVEVIRRPVEPRQLLARVRALIATGEAQPAARPAGAAPGHLDDG
jgi:two-component system cell cycle response regulator